MPRIKTPSKAKEPVRIRERKLANGNISLYLDIYSKGARKVESLGLYIVPEKTPLDKSMNKEARRVAERVKAERILAIQDYGANQFEKIKRIGITLSDWLLKYQEEKSNISDSTIRGRKNMRVRIMDYLDVIMRQALKLVDADEDFCRGFLEYLKTAPNKTKTKKGGTINNGNALHIQTIFTGSLNKAVREGLIKFNPMQKLDAKEKFHPVENPREFLTIPELQNAIKTDAPNEDIKRAFLFSCFTGLRFSDVEQLTWNKIQSSSDGKSKFVKVQMQKNSKWINIPLSDEAMKWINPKENKEEPIYKLLDPVNVEKHLNTWMKAAGVDKHITYHCSRHSFATMMLTLGVDLYTVSKLLGHSKITTTQIYAKIIDEKKVEAVSKLDNLFG